jgi:uncharacterized integral membrane protein (TIGR00698 family)
VTETRWVKNVFWMLFIASSMPFVSAPLALTGGITFGIMAGNPWGDAASAWSRRMLQASVVGLGFGIDLPELLSTGKSAFLYTAVSICCTIIIGYVLGKLFGTQRKTSILISFGTAICGGSAIAAMAPVIKAEDEETGVALATVFTLNSAALILFPLLGHLLGMGQRQFGLWSALAIHDTSSVVGAGAAYGSLALTIGTTVKLTRALWIMPSALFAAWFTKSAGRVRIPMFIIGFVAAATIRTLLPGFASIWQAFNGVAQQSLVVTLFLIGSCLTREVLGKAGIKPLTQGVVLWFVVSVTSCAAILLGWIN